MAQLLVTAGLPRSGKTTLCNEKYKPMGFTIVNPDSFRLAIHGQRFLAPAEPLVWACVFAAVDALLLAGNDVIVDATNTTEKRRAPWRERGAKFIVVGTTKEECIARATKEGDMDIIPVIERMSQQWESL